MNRADHGVDPVGRETADPYRATDDRGGRRVIAQRGRGAIAGHFALAIAGLATPLLAGAVLDEAPPLFLLAMLAFPLGLLGLGRAIHACVVPHVIEIDDTGLHFAWATRVLAMPWLARHDRELPWSSLRAVRVHTVSINGLTTTELVVTTDDGSFEIPDDRFDRPAYLIQRDILDFVDRTRERPPASAFAQRMRERFAMPEQHARPPWAMLGACAFFMPFIGFPAWLAITQRSWLTYGFATVAAVVFGYLMVLGWRNWWRGRVLCFGPDGLSIGPDPTRARLIRWDEIQAVRREKTNGKLDALDIVEHDGTHTALRHGYGRSLFELASIIDPRG